MKIPEFVRIIVAEMTALLVAWWVSVALWHYFEPAKDVWYREAWGATCGFIGLLVGVIIAMTIWWSTRETGAEHGKT